jgi:hypothetical protein
MSEPVYDRLANVFTLVAVGSALLFNSASPWHWVVGGFGVAAGVAAVVLYFLNQSRNRERPDATEVPEEKDARAEQEPLSLGENRMLGLGAESAKQYVLGAYLFDYAKAARFYTDRNLVQHSRNAHLVYWRSYHEEVLQLAEGQEISLSPNDIAACAIEIIRSLSSGDDRDQWEFNFGPKGLRVVPAKGIKDRTSIEDRSAIGQSEFESEQISKMVN